MPPPHIHVPPVQNNQPGTGFGSQGILVRIIPTVTPLGKLPALCIGARGAIWAHIQILLSRNSGSSWIACNMSMVGSSYV